MRCWRACSCWRSSRAISCWRFSRATCCRRACSAASSLALRWACRRLSRVDSIRCWRAVSSLSRRAWRSALMRSALVSLRPLGANASSSAAAPLILPAILLRALRLSSSSRALASWAALPLRPAGAASSASALALRPALALASFSFLPRGAASSSSSIGLARPLTCLTCSTALSLLAARLSTAALAASSRVALVLVCLATTLAGAWRSVLASTGKATATHAAPMNMALCDKYFRIPLVTNSVDVDMAKSCSLIITR